ncbi:MAG: thioredoxin [Epsilonproteobacteria bacterium]|nr:thioredoxin [Campylobacterota bacterium]NPA64568.1 thioredoxin family protein [Campylobacterota bacterium]
MKRLNEIEAIEDAIKQEAALLYISAPNCNVCEALKPKIRSLFERRFPKITLYEANIAHTPELAGRFNIMSAPAILLFFDGKEFAREGRNISIDLFEQKVAKIYQLYFDGT